MKIKTLAITLYQKDNGGEIHITDEDIQNDINKRIEDAGITPENLIDVKMNSCFFDTSTSNDMWLPEGTMIIWNILVIYKGE